MASIQATFSGSGLLLGWAYILCSLKQPCPLYLCLQLHDGHLSFLLGFIFEGVLEVSVGSVVLLLGLGVLCFHFLFGGSRGLTLFISGFLGGPPGVWSSLPFKLRLLAPFPGLAPLWEASGESEREDPSHREWGPLIFSLLFM